MKIQSVIKRQTFSGISWKIVSYGPAVGVRVAQNEKMTS